MTSCSQHVRWLLRWIGSALAIWTVLCLYGASFAAEAIAIPDIARKSPVDFQTEILPILRANCLACHHEKKANGNLVLETPQSILKGGDLGPAVVAGRSAESLILKVAAHQLEPTMPPPENMVGATSLTPEQLGLLKLWIDQGAAGQAATSRDISWQQVAGKYQPAMATAISPDGQVAVFSRGNHLLAIQLPGALSTVNLVDPTLRSAAERSPATEVAHRDFVRSLAFNATGDVLASGGFREVKLWRRPRINREVDWVGDTELQSTAVSGDQRWIAAGDVAGRIQLRELATGKVGHLIAAHQKPVTGIAFSADHATLYSCSLDQSLKAWDVKSGQQIGTGIEHPGAVLAVITVQPGSFLVTICQDGKLRIWNEQQVRDAGKEAAKPLNELPMPGGPAHALAVAPASPNEFVTGGQDGAVRRWNAESGKQVAELRMEGAITAVATSGDGSRIVAAGRNRVALWDREGKLIAQWLGDPRLAEKSAKLDADVTFTKAGISHAEQDLKSYEGLIRIAGVRKEDIKKAEEELGKAQKLRDEKRTALEKAKSEKGKLEGPEKALADAETAVLVAMTVIDRAKAISERTNKELADAEGAMKAREERLKQLESARQDAVNAAKSSELQAQAVALTADGKSVVVGCDSGVQHVYETETGRYQYSLAEHQGRVSALLAIPGRILSVAADRRLVVWNASGTWSLERVIGMSSPAETLADRVLSIDFSPDGKWLATGSGVPSRSGELKIWNVADGKLVREFPGAHAETVFAVRFSPDGKYLASASGDRFIKIFDAHTGEQVKRLAGHTGQVLALSWKADGTQLISGGYDNVLKLWDVAQGVPLKTMKGTTYRIGTYKREITTVSFIGASEQIASTSGDGTVRLHRTTSENDILTYSGSKGYQFSVAVSPDGRAVIAGGSDGTVRIWTGTEQQPKQTLAP